MPPGVEYIITDIYLDIFIPTMYKITFLYGNPLRHIQNKVIVRSYSARLLGHHIVRG